MMKNNKDQLIQESLDANNKELLSNDPDLKAYETLYKMLSQEDKFENEIDLKSVLKQAKVKISISDYLTFFIILLIMIGLAVSTNFIL